MATKPHPFQRNTAARRWGSRAWRTAIAVGLCTAGVVSAGDEPPTPPSAPRLEAAARDPVSREPPSLADVQQALSRARTVLSRFTQERHLALFDEPLRSEGFLCSESSGRLRWEITDPYRSILVSDGRGVAQFEWINEAWQKLDLGLADALEAVVRQIGLVIQGRYGDEDTGYAVTTGHDGEGPVLTLVPRAPALRRMLDSIEVQLAPDLRGTRQVLLRETSGDYTRIRFSDQQINGAFLEDTFNRTQPLPLETVRSHFLKSELPASMP